MEEMRNTAAKVYLASRPLGDKTMNNIDPREEER